jgi:hypothetical protein
MLGMPRRNLGPILDRCSTSLTFRHNFRSLGNLVEKQHNALCQLLLKAGVVSTFFIKASFQ